MNPNFFQNTFNLGNQAQSTPITVIPPPPNPSVNNQALVPINPNINNAAPQLQQDPWGNVINGPFISNDPWTNCWPQNCSEQTTNGIDSHQLKGLDLLLKTIRYSVYQSSTEKAFQVRIVILNCDTYEQWNSIMFCSANPAPNGPQNQAFEIGSEGCHLKVTIMILPFGSPAAEEERLYVRNHRQSKKNKEKKPKRARNKKQKSPKIKAIVEELTDNSEIVDLCALINNKK